MTTRQILAGIYGKIRRCEGILGSLKRMARDQTEILKFEGEKSSNTTVQIKKSNTDMGKEFYYFQIDILESCTIAEALASIPTPYGIPVRIPNVTKFSYTTEPNKENFEKRITLDLFSAGCMLSAEEVEELEFQRIGRQQVPESTMTADGVVHRCGVIYISDKVLLQPFCGGPVRFAPALSQSIGNYTPTLYLSPFGPQTQIFIGLPAR